MRFLFFPIGCIPFHGKTLEERPLGGIETSVIRLAEALEAMGHDVNVVTDLKSYPETRPRYIPFQEIESLGILDVVVIVRTVKGIIGNYNCKKRFFWTGDSWDNIHTYGLSDKRYIELLDGLLLVSDWHAITLCEASGFPQDKVHVLRNGIHLDYFKGAETRHRKRLIYSSQPYRGLQYLPAIFKALKKKHPDLELHLFSSDESYSVKWSRQKREEGIFTLHFEELTRLPGCYDHGGILQKDLAREFMKSALWIYPTAFEETGCITAMEAQAAGCVAVTTDLAALKEIVGEAGLLIEQKPGTDQYRDLFVEACDRLLTDDGLFNKLSELGKERARAFDWRCRAEEFVNYLRDRHQLT